MSTFELSNGVEMAFQSMGHALEYAHNHGLRVVRRMLA